VYLALLHHQVHVLQGDYPCKTLGDPLHLQNGSHLFTPDSSLIVEPNAAPLFPDSDVALENTSKTQVFKSERVLANSEEAKH